MAAASIIREAGRGGLLGMFPTRVAVCLMPAAFLLASSPVAAQAVVPTDARPMTGVELYMMFRGKSWKWKDGAGFMRDEGRLFKAWARDGKKATWAEGRWIVTDSGMLCLKATWHSKGEAAEDKTCFSHHVLDDTIYQRREPAGDWYVFKHGKPAADDEFYRLVNEDLVSARLPIIQELIGTETISGANSIRPRPEANEVGGVQ